MNTFVEDFKNVWSKPNNTLIQLIVINVLVFVVVGIFSVFSGTIAAFLYGQLAIPSYLPDFIFKPWTIFTYFVTHLDFLHILGNMFALYWFGMLVDEYLGHRRLRGLYIIGGIGGAVAYLLIYNLIPYYEGVRVGSTMIGASASVYAVVVGAATLIPDYQMRLILLGPVRIKYIALAYVVISFLGASGANAGGNIAHLGGALVGFVFVKQLQAGSDWSLPITKMVEFFSDLFSQKPKLKVTHRKSSTEAKSTGQKSSSDKPDQGLVDAILDKISESGYERLTKEEKQILFKASNDQKGGR